jgi:anhydro-N-acetylmuramic acid kinase
MGLMSGTSLDGVDAVLVDFSDNTLQVLGHCGCPFPTALREAFLTLNTAGDNELHRAALAGNALARLYADQVQRLLQQCGVTPDAVHAIGAHGQTVRHRPQEFDGIGYTLQINQPALLAELSGITVVADFRSRDVAAGGQGAPLVPPFHRAFFAQLNRAVTVLNLGGIANVTLLNPQSDTLQGFDCGPANTLMDIWCQRHTGQPFDAEGAWAAQGTVHSGLLERLLDEPYFTQPPPKSTGRDRFHADWLAHKMAGLNDVESLENLPPQDVQATLCELTAITSARSVLCYQPQCTTLIVCGGGAYNRHLMQRLQAWLPLCEVVSSAAFNLPPTQVEAVAFAWLARQTMNGLTASHPSVTGSRGSRILGSIYPSSPASTPHQWMRQSV